MDPTGLLDSETAEPQRVDGGKDQAEADFPRLSEVPEEPGRRPSTRSERKAMQESLAADRANARYSDEALRAPEAAPEQPEALGRQRVEGEPDGATAETRPQPDPARASDGPEQAAAQRQTETGAVPSRKTEAQAGGDPGRAPGSARDTAAEAARDASGTPDTGGVDAMPEVPPAPSEMAQSEGGAGAAAGPREAGRGDAPDESAGDGMQAAGAPDSGTGRSPDTAQRETEKRGTAQGETGRRDAEPGAAQTARAPANGSAERGPAVQVNRSQIPQIRPSRQGEPVQLPTQVRQRVSSGTAGSADAMPQRRQRARLQTPPARASEVGPRADTDADGAGEQLAVIYFGHASAALNGEDRQVLQKVAELYDKHGGGLRVVGHASSRTATMDMIQHRMANLDISMRRAENVADALVKDGVPRGKIMVEARADRDPAYHEFMPTGEAGNRRAEIFLTN